ncbi:MAG: DUF6089 family protein [Cytophagales bacterium]|nr:DUF6089 family protein [Cytophagales bacterium]
MRKLLFAALTLFFLFTQVEDSLAQFSRKGIKNGNKRMTAYRGTKARFGKGKVYSAVGFSLNAVNYYGDLAPSPSKISTDLSFTKPGFAISYMHRFGPRFSVMGQFMFATLKGSDNESASPGDLENGIFRYKRNMSFRNQIKELSAVAMFDLFENQSTYMSRAKWTPYVYAGLALVLHNPQAIAPATDLQGNALSQAGEYVDLQPLGTEGQYSTLSPTDVNTGIKPYSLLQIVIPFGLGARFRLTDVLDLSADIGLRYTFTDYLDDVSANYVDLNKLNSPLAQAMSYRTNELYNNNPPNPRASGIPGVNVEGGYGMEAFDNKRGGKNDNDVYMVTSIRLTYIIRPNFHQAKFR